MKRVKITKNLPTAKYGTELKNQVPYIDNTAAPNLGIGDVGSNPRISVNKTLKSVPREKANLEAEVGETAVTDLNSDGLPEFYKIGGQKHSKGGTPLNLPNNSFIFSNSKELAIKDPKLLMQFGKSVSKKNKKGFTPAQLSKTYDINNYRQVLADPDSDMKQIETAEMMIKNYMDKLGALALVQESMKGFENGIPNISLPYLQKIGISSEDILPPPPQQSMPPQQMPQQIPKATTGLEVFNEFYQPESDPFGLNDSESYFNKGTGDWVDTDISVKEKTKGAFNPAAAARFAIDGIYGGIMDLAASKEKAKNEERLIRGTVQAGFNPVDAERGKWGPNNRMYDAKGQEYPVQSDIYTGKYGGAIPEARYGLEMYPQTGPGDPVPVKKVYIDPRSAAKTAALQNFINRRYANNPKFRSYAEEHLQPEGNIFMASQGSVNTNNVPLYNPEVQGKEYIQNKMAMEGRLDRNSMDHLNTIYLSENAMFDEYGNRIDPKYLQEGTQFIPTSKREIKRNFRNFKNKKYEHGGPHTETVPETSTKPTKTQNLPDDAVVHDVTDPNYDPGKVKEGNYIKRDGKYYKVGKRVYPEYKGPSVDKLDQRLKGEYGDRREDYGRLVYKFNTDEDLRKAFIKNFDEEVAGLKPGKNYTQAHIDKLKSLDDQQKIDYFLNGQKHNMMISAQMGDVANVTNVGQWDRGKKNAQGIPVNYAAAVKQVGLEPLTVDQTLGLQAGYIGVQKMENDPELKKKLKNFNIFQSGVGDEGAAGKKTISEADGWQGNTTSGEMLRWKPTDFTFEEEEVEWTEEAKKEEPEKETKGVEDKSRSTYTPYWTQDLRNVSGALYDLASVKKYNPWQAMPQMSLATPNFADFRGAAARLGSMAQSGAQQLATFGNPQAFGAGFANIQRNLAQNIGQLQDQEYKTNVATANQFEMSNTALKNQFSQLAAKARTDLYDKQMIANQQYDNARRALRWNMINAMNQADTNRGLTQTANTLTPNQYLDPTTGFTTFIDDGRQFLPTTKTPSVQEQVLKNAQTYMRDNPGMDWATATKIASTGINKNTASTTANNQSTLQGYPGYPLNSNRRKRQQPAYSRFMHGGSNSKKKCRVLRLPNK